MLTEEKPERSILLQLLAEALRDGRQALCDGSKTDETRNNGNPDWAAIVDMAAKHGVISLVYEPLRTREVPEAVRKRAEQAAQTVVRQNYRLLYLSWQIQQAMREKDIGTVLLKGMGTASFYPVPELRKSGDIDILLTDPKDLEGAARCLEQLGFRKKEWQPALHHVVYSISAGNTPAGGRLGRTGSREIEVELHTMLAEPFDDGRVNALLKRQAADIAGHLQAVTVFGLPLEILDPAYHAYELLLHMLQHFLRSGFGLKLLCDWAAFWNREMEPAVGEEYLALVRSCGVKRFSDLVSLVCVRYLGLSRERIAFMEPDGGLETEAFLKEIFVAEEFGRTSNERMVALRGSSPWDYVREFHHQMHLNYPRAGKCVLLWPALWGLTLVRFLVNNRRVRSVSLIAVLKAAGQRGKLLKKLRLFQQEH